MKNKYYFVWFNKEFWYVVYGKIEKICDERYLTGQFLRHGYYSLDYTKRVCDNLCNLRICDENNFEIKDYTTKKELLRNHFDVLLTCKY